MAALRNSKTRRRDKVATQSAILEAVRTILCGEGYGALGINAIAKQAGADKVLIYRYFGNLSAVFKAFAEQAEIWPTPHQVLGDAPAVLRALAPGERLGLVLSNYGRALAANPIALELLAWEPVDDATLGRTIAPRRQAITDAIAASMAADGGAECGALIEVLLGAVHRLVLEQVRRAQRGDNAEVEPLSAWVQSERVIAQLCRHWFGQPKPKSNPKQDLQRKPTADLPGHPRDGTLHDRNDKGVS